jgi:glycogen debranching enzyme
LRSLAPEDPAYRGSYEGGTDERALASHQGTVWPWLLAYYCEAGLRAYGPDRERTTYLLALLNDLAEELPGRGLNHLSELFDGDPPHRPGGAFARAWNVGEILRAYQLLEGALR